MEFQRRFGKRKRANPKKGIMLVLLLALVLFLWFQAENIITKLFN